MGIGWVLIGVCFLLPAIAHIQGQDVTWEMWILNAVVITGMEISFKLQEIKEKI